MCFDEASAEVGGAGSVPRLDRRQALALGVGALLIGRRSVEQHPRGVRTPIGDGLEIRSRDEWAAGLPPRGPLQPEPDVRFLLVHHTAGSNAYRADQVPGQIRQVYAFHTGPHKRWPDVCYNFFVDRFGGIWEGRAGSANGPVMADATGGSQGFAQLVCLLGDFEAAPPTTSMVTSLEVLLAFLGERYSIDPRPGATTTFVSRGSQRWRRGTTVTARTVSAHREMSYTVCPGRFMVPLLDLEVPYRVAQRRGVALPQDPTPPAPPEAPTAAAGDRRLTVSWTEEVEPEGLPSTGYEIVVSPGGRTVRAASSPIVVSQLTNGVAYTVRVVAINAAGRSAASVPSTPVTPCTVPGRAVRPLVRSGVASAVVAWTQPLSGGSAIMGYTVTASPGGATCSTVSRSCTVEGLRPGVAYTFTVQAHNAVGPGPVSLPSAAVRPR